jgi:fructose-1,6-bisphosphatase/sedoheptulose 1,7-bisphosphatase-like protein
VYQLRDGNLGFDFLRVAEAAALASLQWFGRGGKASRSQGRRRPDATDAVDISMRGVRDFIGEGREKRTPDAAQR